jgi:hypothetical protein
MVVSSKRMLKNANMAVTAKGRNDHICVKITTDSISIRQIMRKSLMLHSHSCDLALRFCG